MKMRSRWTWTIAAAAAAAAVTLVLHTVRAQDSAPASAPAPQNIRTAVCNAYQIMKQYNGIIAMRQSLDREQETLSAEVKHRVDEVEKLTEELKSLSAGSQAYQAKQNQIDQKKSEAKSWEEAQLMQRMRRAADAIEKGHQVLEQAVKEVAREQGFHVVLNHSEMGLEGLKPDEMQAVVRGQRVLYNDDSLDITQPVLDRMNALYAAQAK
jgi:Skp family chaperone for outer membrane proteins